MNSKFEITDEEFSLLASLVYREAGIALGDHKRSLLVGRLSKRLMRLNLEDFGRYYRLVKEDEEERRKMIDLITTNTTNFFRENHHFEFLLRKALPALISARRASRTLRIWSAGCSTGEEPYSIAITLCETFRKLGIDMRQWDVKILASDISARVLDHARLGIYDRKQLPEDLSPEYQERYFRPGSNGSTGKWHVRDTLKSIIRFRSLNLMDAQYPFHRTFDILFCRNVMIYFDEPTREKLFTRFQRHLADDGYLFLGHSETLFERCRFVPVAITVFQKASAEEAKDSRCKGVFR